jgi:hypothetical protein
MTSRLQAEIKHGRPALMVAVMLVERITAHAKGRFFATAAGVELAFLYTAAARATLAPRRPPTPAAS